MDGLTATRLICQSGSLPHGWIIAMTLCKEIERKCLEAGMDDYISKPIRGGNGSSVSVNQIEREVGERVWVYIHLNAKVLQTFQARQVLRLFWLVLS